MPQGGGVRLRALHSLHRPRHHRRRFDPYGEPLHGLLVCLAPLSARFRSLPVWLLLHDGHPVHRFRRHGQVCFGSETEHLCPDAIVNPVATGAIRQKQSLESHEYGRVFPANRPPNVHALACSCTLFGLGFHRLRLHRESLCWPCGSRLFALMRCGDCGGGAYYPEEVSWARQRSR